MNSNKKLYVGGSGFVYAIDRSSGDILWETELKKGWIKRGRDFVTLMEAEDGLYAFAYGTLYRLDLDSGAILWEKPIPRLKHGVGIIATGMDVSYSSEVACGGDADGGGDGDGGNGGD